MGISVVINTKNAEATLEGALLSVRDFADEIVVVDMMSVDDTKKIAQKFTDKIYSHQDVGYVEPARNFALSKATQDWVLILDADEEIPLELAQKLQTISKDIDNQIDCYYLARKNMIFGQWVSHTGWWPDFVLRFFKKGMVEWSNEIHSVPITHGLVGELVAEERLAILHHNYPSVASYLERLNRYTSIQAEEKLARNEVVHAQDSTINLIKSWKTELFSRLFAQEGYKDGTVGIALSWLQGMSEMIVSLKVWEQKNDLSKKQSKTEILTELRIFQKDLNYWLANMMVEKNTGLKKLWWRVRRRFRV